MERLLIVNADDFGLSKGLNYGIIEACKNGVVTSTTAMTNGSAISHAAQLSQCVPELAIGMHFVLTLGQPLSTMPDLTREGYLGKWIWKMADEDCLPLDEITCELECQYRRFVEVFGRKPTHIDGHHSVHMIAQIYPIVSAFAHEKGIPMRIDRQLAERSNLEQNAVCSTDGFSREFYGQELSESLFVRSLDASLARGESTLEMMCHPAFVDETVMASSYCYPRLAELDILTSDSLRYAIAERGYRLGTYSDL